MNCSFYILELAVIAIGVGAWLHVSDHDRKYVTRAEFDKHLAEIRLDLERLGASRRDVVPSAADVNHEVGERNDCAKRYKDGGFCFHGEHFTTIKEDVK